MAQLAAMAQPLVTRRFRDLYADADAICRFEPSALFLVADELEDQDAGALRMIRALVAELSVVVVSSDHREVQQRSLAQRIGAEVLTKPFSQGELADVLDRAIAGHGGASTAALLDLARGISDEVNNPLMFVGGHLQLLQRSVEALDDAHALDHAKNLSDGLERIRKTMEKVRLLADAGGASTARGLVNLYQLAGDVIARQSDGTAVSLDSSPNPEESELLGDPQLLATLIEHLTSVAAALRANASTDDPARLSIQPSGEGVVLRATIDARDLPAWQLPRTFDPYYLTRILRETPHGLSLYLVRVIAQNHGGLAVARWTQGGELALEILMPRGPGRAAE